VSGKMRRDACGWWSPPETGETVACQSNSLRGDGRGCSKWPKGVSKRRGSSWAHWSEARRSGVEEIEGEAGGPMTSRVVGDNSSTRGEGGRLGARAAARGVREGVSSGMTRGRRARAAAGERRRARRVAGRR
jgi:hypothetical protein